MAQSPYRVLCVCLGNICRSPTAEVVLKHYIKQAGLNIEVDSAGTSNYHPNKAPDSRSQKFAKNKGYDLSSLKARQVIGSDFEQFDLILAMDHNNLNDLQLLLNRQNSLFNETPLRATLALMSEHDAIYPQQAVPDPYYGGQADFERVIQQCESAAQAWIAHWLSREDLQHIQTQQKR